MKLIFIDTMSDKKPKKSYNTKPKDKHKILARKIIESGGKEPMGKLIKESGWSEKTAVNPKKITESKGYKQAAKPFLEQIENEIQEALLHLPNVREKAGYGESVSSIEKLKKLEQLLKGESTENNSITIKWQE